MFKSWFPESKDMLPLTWWKQTPIYLSAILALGGALSMVVFAILGPLMSYLVFSFDSAFKQWHLWTPLTYVMVNAPSIWTLLSCFFLWRFGESVERHFGRRVFVKLLVLLVAVSPITITLLHLAGLPGMMCAGISQLGFAIFIAFATVYPRAQISLIIVTLEVWILAAIFVGINALECLAFRQWAALILLATNVAAAYLYIRYQKGELQLPKVPKIRVLPDPVKPAKSAKTPPPKKSSKSPGGTAPTVDEILDKISSQGIQSLTDEERKILSKASEDK